MKRIITILIVSMIGLNLSAQSFDTYIRDNDKLYPMFNTIELPNNEYVVGVNLINASNDFYGTELYKLSSNGVILDSLVLPYVIRNVLYYKQKIYFSGLNVGALDTLIYGTINLQQFDTTAVIKYQTQLHSAFLLELTYSNVCNCMITVGYGTDTNSVQQGIVFQFDTALNILREKQYKPWNYARKDTLLNLVLYGILDNPVGDGYWALSSAAVDSVNDGWKGYTTGAVVILLDSNLNRDSTQVYQLRSNKYFQGAFIDIRDQPFGGVKLTDSTYLFAGTVLDMDISKNRFVQNDVAYLITDNNLNTLKHEFYGKVDTLDFGAWNMVDRNEDYVYAFHFSGLPLEGVFENFFGLTKIDEAGNRLWTHYYSTPEVKLAYSVTATSDGGALMVGTSLQFGHQKEDVYILKVDSTGDRILTSTLSSSEIEKENYRIYPNPAKDNLNLLKINQFKPYKFELYDTFGRLVKTVKWSESHQQINVADLASGMYVYRITDEEGRKGSGKIMVE